MLRRVKLRPFFSCLPVRADAVAHRRPWWAGCLQSSVSTSASEAIKHHHHVFAGTHVKLFSSKESRIHSNAIVSESKICSRFASETSRDAKVSVYYASKQEVDAKLCSSKFDAKSHLADGKAQVLGCVTHTPHAQVLCSSADVKDTAAISSSCERQSLETKFEQGPQEAQKLLQTKKQPADLLQKIELLASEHFSASDVVKVLKVRVVKSLSAQQLATALQEMRKSFPRDKLVRDIVVRSPKVLSETAELVQRKLKILGDFQVEEKVITKLCGKGGVLLLTMESMQKKLMFYESIGLTVAGRNMMFWRAPLILRLGIEKSIQPALKFLESKGFTKQKALKIAQHRPHIFYMSLDSLMRKYEYITQLGFSIDKFPMILLDRSSINCIEQHLQTLRDLGFTDDDVLMMVRTQPALLLLSSENVRGKVNFLINKQHRKMEEIVRNPSCLVYSLQARLIPRFTAVNNLHLPRKYSLGQIVIPTDSNFAKWLKKSGILGNDACIQQLETHCVET